MRTRSAIFVAAIVASCATTASTDGPPPGSDRSAKPPPIQVAPPPPPPVTPDAMAIGDYQSEFLEGASQYFQGRRTVSAAASSTIAPAHDIVIVKTIGRASRSFVFTSGLGRVRRPHAGLSDEHRHVELVAYSKDAGPQIGAILSVIGVRLFAARAAPKAYDAITLSAPMFGLRHFDLRPAGEVDVGDLRVRLYKVVPMTLDELEETKAQGGSQWVDSAAADPAVAARELLRWVPALEQ